MSRDSEDFDVQQSLDSMASDPAFLAYAAGIDAEEDFGNGISLLDGLLSRRQSGHCLTEVQVNAYRDRYQWYALRQIAVDAEIPVWFPYCPF